MSDLIALRKRDARLAGGAALLAKGFRPFFLLAALHAVAMVPLWILVHTGVLGVGDYFLPTSWHAHEMVFGYTAAVVAGFMLTAAANWTKRETATGGLLALLCLVWILGRIAPVLAGHVPRVAIAIMSLAFFPLLALVLARVIVGARSKRNYGILGIIVALFGAQLATHLGVLGDSVSWQVMGPKLGVDLVVVLMLVIGGRIIPMFTRNATKAEGIRSIVLLDQASIAAALAVLVTDALMVHGIASGAIAALAAVLSLGRVRHWGLRPAMKVPLLWVLHIGYLFIPLGFAMRALATFVPRVGTSTALHLMTAGAIGTLTLGMMTRVSLGHTGRILVAPKVLSVAFVLVITAALVRVVGPLIGGAVSIPSLHASATLWSLAFLAYLVRIGPSLLQPRPDGRAG